MPPALRCERGAVEDHVRGIVDGAAIAPLALQLLAGLLCPTACLLTKPVRSVAQLARPLTCLPLGDHLQIQRNGDVALPVQGANIFHVLQCLCFQL